MALLMDEVSSKKVSYIQDALLTFASTIQQAQLSALWPGLKSAL